MACSSANAKQEPRLEERQKITGGTHQQEHALALAWSGGQVVYRLSQREDRDENA